jgi:hypothetical protein
MPLENFIIAVFCQVDDFLKKSGLCGRALRKRGFSPKLSDSEVLTMMIVGEIMGRDTDKGIWRYFRQHWCTLFPMIGSRTNWAREGADLWVAAQDLHQVLAAELGAMSNHLHIVDGFPMRTCVVTRAYRSRLFKGATSWGYCASKKEHYYGLHGHILIDFNGVVVGIEVTAANVSERDVVWGLVDGKIRGMLLGDKGYIGEDYQNELRIETGINLQTALRSNMQEDRDPKFIQALKTKRRLVETVIGQFVEGFNIEKIWARDLWHLTCRIGRKILAHTVGVFFNRMLGRDSLALADLIQA